MCEEDNTQWRSSHNYLQRPALAIDEIINNINQVNDATVEMSQRVARETVSIKLRGPKFNPARQQSHL